MKQTERDIYKEAKEWGIDISLIDANLKCTPTERVLRHQAALEAMLAFREAGRKFYAEHTENSQAAKGK